MNSCFGTLSYKAIRISSSTGSFAASDDLSVIQDLDLYFVRQIAHSLQEYDLEQKINLETKMREGTTKLLAACKHASQTLEAAKSLLVSNERMTVYISELQERRAGKQNTTEPKPVVQNNVTRAKVAISDIRFPLIWKDTDHFKNKGDYRRFSAFCLLKLGSEVFDTALVNNIDRTTTDIPFEDVIVFPGALPEFELKIEVYSHILYNDLSIASTPRKLKKRISNSISRTIGKKLATSLKEELSSVDIGPKFDLVAQATLKLEDASDDIHTHDLVLENLENPHNQLPLFGHFCCRLAVQPECIVEERISGSLMVFQQYGNTRKFHRMWGVLKGFSLSLWAKLEDSDQLPPTMAVSVNKNSKVSTDSQISGNQRCFRILNMVSGKANDHIFTVDNDSEFSNWVSQLRQHIKDQELWGHATDQIMDIPSPETSRSIFLRPRQGSLYEETRFTEPLHSSPSTSSSLYLHSPSIHSRSSSSSAASSACSTHLPFL